jgi:hypothetical protein
MAGRVDFWIDAHAGNSTTVDEPSVGRDVRAWISASAWSFREQTFLGADATNLIVPLTKNGGNHKGTT